MRNTIILAAIASLLATAALAGPLERINHEANKVRPHADAALPDGQYDCEDYAAAKLRALRSAGLGDGARMWWVLTPKESHAVVVLRDGRVLDNLFADVATRRDLVRFHGYLFLAPMQEPDQ